MSTLVVDYIEPRAGGTGASIQYGLAKATWSYNQGTATIQNSSNITAITDSATGVFYPRYTNEWLTRTYWVHGIASTNTAQEGTLYFRNADARRAGSTHIGCATYAGSLYDDTSCGTCRGMLV